MPDDDEIAELTKRIEELEAVIDEAEYWLEGGHPDTAAATLAGARSIHTPREEVMRETYTQWRQGAPLGFEPHLSPIQETDR